MCVCSIVLSAPCSLLVTCWEMAHLLALFIIWLLVFYHLPIWCCIRLYRFLIFAFFLTFFPFCLLLTNHKTLYTLNIVLSCQPPFEPITVVFYKYRSMTNKKCTHDNRIIFLELATTTATIITFKIFALASFSCCKMT